MEMSKKKLAKCLYALYTDSVVLNPAWFDYIHNHYKEVCNFSIHSFNTYAMQFNYVPEIKSITVSDWDMLLNH